MTIKEVSEQYDISQDTLRYYERVGLIPAVTRTAGGIRDYQAEDLRWVELARCMRSAGLSVEALIEYVRLTQAGDATIPARLQLLREQKEQLQIQRAKIDAALARLDQKIERYQIAEDTGVLSWPGKQ
jgi:DNA-binding transcriptional MerR regulator